MEIEEQAQLHELKEWEIRNRTRPPEPVYKPGEAGYGPKECAECDEEMPAQRRAYGYHLCTQCKSELELLPTRRRR